MVASLSVVTCWRIFGLISESQGLIQAVRLYEMTDDPGVKDHLSFMIARDPCIKTSG